MSVHHLRGGVPYRHPTHRASVSPAWAAKVGTGKTLNWPAGKGTKATAA
jgi:hypothetical protein